MNCAECGAPLSWNPLRGIFECESCQRLFRFLAGHLQPLSPPATENLRPPYRHDPDPTL